MTLERVSVIESCRPCPVCHAHAGRRLHTMHFALPDDSPLPTQYHLLVCLHCGIGYADSAATADAYDRYYRHFSRYEDTAVATGGGDDPVDRQRIENTAEFLSAQVQLSARVLDVGCGNGGLLAALRRRGFTDLTGLDPAAACIARIKAEGFAAVHASLPLCDPATLRDSSGSFDLIVMSHVLEHAFDAHRALDSLLPLLVPGGHLYIETPDASRYCMDGFPPLYFFDPEHINHFDEESLKYLGRTLGLLPIAGGEKSLALSNGQYYPAAFVLFRSSHASALPSSPVARLYPLLLAYVKESLEDLLPLRDRLFSLVGDDESLALWGAGSLAQRLLSEPWFPVRRLLAIVDRDRNKQGLRFAGLTIETPEMGLRQLPERSVVLCAAAIAGKTIEQDYRQLGLSFPFHVITS